MSTEDLLFQSKMERDSIKAQIYDAEKRIAELNGIIAALEKVQEISKEEEKE